MGLNRSEKAVVIEEVAARVAAAKAIVVAEYRGLEVGQITSLRKQARQNGVYLRVLKNTLARRAVANAARTTAWGDLLVIAILTITKQTPLAG